MTRAMNTTSQSAGPLSGLRVLDIATIIAAPSAASLLADYGADVVKLELPDGDGARGFPPSKDGAALWWKVINRNKKLGTLDLRKPEGRELFLRMLPQFDVLVENFRPGTLDRWGLDKETLWAAQPRLVILRVTGFGQTGPYRDRPGFARIFEAMGGLAYISGEPDAEPMHAGYPIGDSIGGLFGATGILAALWKRARDPDAPGEEIDLSLTEAVFKLLDSLAIRYDQLGEVHERSGNRNQYSAPAAVFVTADHRWVTLAGSTDGLYANNCRAIGRPDLIEDERFRTNRDRVRHADELNRMFAAWCAAHSLEEVLADFHAAGGTIAPIYGADQIFTDPQMQARGFLRKVADDDFGTVRVQDVVPRFANDPCHVAHTAGRLGRDNDAIYGSLGLEPGELRRLREQRVI
jgi:crotonobetainyl-CoA:carnitine CoA-transferase CaiB-like acyl-CoA transferase